MRPTRILLVAALLAAACVSPKPDTDRADSSAAHPDATSPQPDATPGPHMDATSIDAEPEDSAMDASDAGFTDGAPDADTGAPIDAHIPDAGTPDAGDGGPPPAGVPRAGFVASGERKSSAHFILFSSTGQSTPVGTGKMQSSSFTLAPGTLGR